MSPGSVRDRGAEKKHLTAAEHSTAEPPVSDRGRGAQKKYLTSSEHPTAESSASDRGRGAKEKFLTTPEHSPGELTVSDRGRGAKGEYLTATPTCTSSRPFTRCLTEALDKPGDITVEGTGASTDMVADLFFWHWNREHGQRGVQVYPAIASLVAGAMPSV